jgi:arylsulfatase A-like enzyme
MKQIPSLTLTALLLASLASVAAATGPAKPNILLLLADDLGYADLGCQGSAEVKTPHIDSLAKNGVRFTAGYVNGTYCSPTRAALMTGRYPQRYGYEINPDEVTLNPPGTSLPDGPGLPRSEKTLAEFLKPLGYHTALVGKWHLGFSEALLPRQRGFDEALHFPNYGKQPPVTAFRNGSEVKLDDWAIDAMTRESVNFIERHAAEPWFLFLSFTETHGILRPKPEVLERFSHIADLNRRKLVAAAALMDGSVGAVLETVRRLNLEENTLIIFLSDNGGSARQNFSLNTPLRGGKGSTQEGGIRIPFLMQWKGRLPAGRIDERPVIGMDIAPTVLAATGSPTPVDAKFDGVNLLPFLLGERAESPHEILFWRFQPFWAVRQGNWKLVKSQPPDARPRDLVPTLPLDLKGAQLFNLSEDIGETRDLAVAHPEKLKELWSAWQAWNQSVEPPRWIPDPEQRLERLRAAKAKAKEE